MIKLGMLCNIGGDTLFELWNKFSEREINMKKNHTKNFGMVLNVMD